MSLLKTGLTDNQQAIFMALVFILPTIITWAGLGFPTDKTALGLLVSGVLSGVLAFLKEYMGGSPTPPGGGFGNIPHK